MISLDEAYVDSMAPNADAAKNGRGLVLKNKYRHLYVSDDETIIFGQCEGSGKNPYECSCDFQRAESPTHRCNCPSRQFPCKHCLGLMYAYAQGKAFTTAPVPEALQAKREKIQARTEKKADAIEKPKNVDKGALAKKIKAQLHGIHLLEKLTLDLVKLGIGNMNAKIAAEISDQAKQLGNTYLPGAQAALLAYTSLFADEAGRFNGTSKSVSGEPAFSEALDQLARLNALIKYGRSYLQRRLDDPDLKPETETAIAAWLGHAWQLRELKEAGLTETGVELVQLAFHSYDDAARRELVDTGVWMTLGSGNVRLTQTFRPYKAAKVMKSDDSFFQVAHVGELFVYPGDLNQRIRWEGMTPRALQPGDLAAIREHAHRDFASVIKEVKTHLKEPLADKRPIVAVHFARLGAVAGTPVIEDRKGIRLVLADHGINEEPPSCHLLSMLPRACHADQTLVVRFRHDLDTRKLQVKPLSLVTPGEIVRLTL